MCAPSSFSTTPPSYPDPVPRCEKSSKTKELDGEGLVKHKPLLCCPLLGNSSWFLQVLGSVYQISKKFFLKNHYTVTDRENGVTLRQLAVQEHRVTFRTFPQGMEGSPTHSCRHTACIWRGKAHSAGRLLNFFSWIIRNRKVVVKIKLICRSHY